MIADFKALFDTKSIDKQFRIYTDDESVVITNSDLFQGEFELNESLCSEETLRFGTCEASSISFTAANNFSSLKGEWLNVDIYLGDEEDPFRLGRYKVEEDRPTAHRVQRSVTAYDAMYTLINADITQWYLDLWNNVVVSMTVKEFRDLLFAHFGITQQSVTLTNDSFVIYQTEDGSSTISGKDALNAICEINGVFGHIGRDGKFYYISIDGGSTYPISNSEQISTDYEEFVTQEIDAVTIFGSDGTVITRVGSATPANDYDVSGLFISTDHTSGFTDALTALFSKIRYVTYRPFDGEFSGNPCYEVGDKISFYDKTNTITTILLERRMTGIQGLRDALSARGTETRQANLNSNAYRTRTITEKIETIKNDLQSEVSKVYIIKNLSNLVVLDNDTNVAILTIPFVIQRQDALVFDIEINLEVETTATIGTSVDIYGDAVGKITYMLDSNDLGIYPMETWEDGKHIMTLHLAFPQISAMMHELVIYMKMNGGQVSIPTLGITAIMTGNGLVANDVWDGILTFRDEIQTLDVDVPEYEFAAISESVIANSAADETETISDSIPGLNVITMSGNVFAGITDSVEIEEE